MADQGLLSCAAGRNLGPIWLLTRQLLVAIRRLISWLLRWVLVASTGGWDLTDAGDWYGCWLRDRALLLIGLRVLERPVRLLLSGNCGRSCCRYLPILRRLVLTILWVSCTVRGLRCLWICLGRVASNGCH